MRKDTVRFAHVKYKFISLNLIRFTFTMKLKSPNYKNHWNILVFYDQWKVISDVSMSHWKMSDFNSIPLFGFTLVIKLRILDFESHWNIFIFFDKERYGVRFDMPHGKMSDFVSFPLFGFTLVIKQKFRF